MKKKSRRLFWAGVGMLLAFVLWTVSVYFVDVRAIGPQGSAVGFVALNESVHRLTGVNMTLYTVTDWLGLVPIAVAFGFSVFGAVQWGKRKALRKVDRSILLLGGFYVLVMAVYVLFEILVINYRPVLINGSLEPSYPSSTTVLVLCVMPTAMMQLRARIKKNAFRRLGTLAIVAFIAFMVIGRLLSGVHWATDILGGIFFSSGMVLLYASVSGLAAGDA